jgi:uncharacterized protein YciI
MKRLLPILPLALAAAVTPSFPVASPAVALEAAADAPLPTRTYRLGLLRRGAAWTPQRTPQTDSIQAGHMANIQRMAEAGALIGAGPFLHGGFLRGVFLFKDDSADVRAMAAEDPAIRSGRLALDLCTLQAQPGVGEPYVTWVRGGGGDSMLTHRLVLLRPGPEVRGRSAAMAERETRRRWIDRLVRNGRLALSGDVGGADSLRAIHVIRGDSSAVAAVLSEDPSVRSGQLVPEVLPWMCAYGVMPGDTLARRGAR